MSTRRVEAFLESLSNAEDIDDVKAIEEYVSVEKTPVAKHYNVDFFLSDLILREWYNGGFISVITYGRQGTGKSVYNIKVAYEVLKHINGSISLLEVIDNYVYFDIAEIVGRLARNGGKRIPVLVWDDAGVHGSSYLWFIDRRRAMLISSLFQTARTILNALLMNAPSPNFIAKHLRSVDSYVVCVVKKNRERSLAIGYRLKILPSGKLWVTKYFIDDFIRRLDAYDYYLRKREKYALYALERLAKALEEDGGKRSEKPRRSRVEKDRELAEKVAVYLEQGWGYYKIARKLNIPVSKVYRIKKKLEKEAGAS